MGVLMDVIDQVQAEAKRISERGGYAEGSVALAVLYAEVLEAVLTRITQMEGHMDKDTYAFLLAPVKGRVEG
jgi:3,4-dihydroxy-2-butanone 4-phosphate synthase